MGEISRPQEIEKDKEKTEISTVDIYRKVFLYLLKLTGDKHVAEDLAQDVVAECLTNPNEQNMVMLTAKNIYLDWVKMNTRERSRHLKAAEEQDHVSHPLVRDPFLREHLIQLTSRIPQRDQSLFKLFFIDELAPKEISASLGLPPDVVRQRLSRLRKKLQNFLKDRGVEP